MLLTKDITSYYLTWLPISTLQPLVVDALISLDRSTIFLPNSSDNVRPACVSGRFCLSLARATAFKGITVRAIGRLLTPRYGLFMPEDREEGTFERVQPLACSKTRDTFTMPKGDYEFLFDVPLSGILIDTLTGPNHAYHSYRVEVVIQRWMRRDLLLSEPVRIYSYPRLNRVRDVPTAVSGNPNKNLGYHFSFPDTLIPHGSAFPVECWFSLSKSTTLSSLSVRVLEKHDLSLPATAAEAVKYDTHYITSSERHVIFAHQTIFADTDASADVQQKGIPVRLPAREHACSQSYSSKSIKIHHVLVIEAEFKQKDSDEATTVKEEFPLHIYMKPDDADIDEALSFGELQSQDTEQTPPPFYELHKLDQIVTFRAEYDTVTENAVL